MGRPAHAHYSHGDACRYSQRDIQVAPQPGRRHHSPRGRHPGDDGGDDPDQPGHTAEFLRDPGRGGQEPAGAGDNTVQPHKGRAQFAADVHCL